MEMGPCTGSDEQATVSGPANLVSASGTGGGGPHRLDGVGRGVRRDVKEKWG